MKLINILVALVVGQKANKAYQQLRVNLQQNPMLRRMFKQSITLYNSQNHQHKREITFDPTALGCKWSTKQALVCKHAQVLNTVGGRVIHIRKSH